MLPKNSRNAPLCMREEMLQINLVHISASIGIGLAKKESRHM